MKLPTPEFDINKFQKKRNWPALHESNISIGYYAGTGFLRRKKTKVLTFVSHYLPGYKSGGPIRTIANMVEHLADELDFLIVTSDRDALDNKPYEGISVNNWNTVGKAKVFYASIESRSLQAITRLIKKTPYNILYLNSFFNPVFTFYPLLARALRLTPKRPMVIAPRGEFSKGALTLKAWKKIPYLKAVRLLGVYRNLFWQASSEYEAEDIRRTMGRFALQINVAPDLPFSMKVNKEPKISAQKVASPLRIVFLSRITPKKNLDFALQVLSQVAVPVEFGVYGPIRDEVYWRRCQWIIKNLPEHVNVNYHGGIKPELVPKIFASYDLFFFPTKGENFGHVILEALCAGTPVLISDQTPWPQDDAGGCITFATDDSLGFIGEIERFARQTPEEYQARRTAAHAAARKFIQEGSLKELNIKLFKDALSGSKN